MNDPACQHAGLFVAIEQELEDDEFVSADSRYHGGFTRLLLQPPRHCTEKLVADRMAERVIDRFETVEIDGF